MRQGVTREMLAEFLGTLVLLIFGLGVVAQTVLSRQTAGSMLSINICWGIAVMMGMYLFSLVMIILNLAAFGPGLFRQETEEVRLQPEPTAC